MRSTILGLGAIGLLLVAGCAVEGSAPEPAATSGGTDVRLVADPEQADLVLYVSNQSFEDGLVRITVTIDGEQLISRDFAVEGQHTWVEFGVELADGEHTLVATSGTGVSTEESFVLPEGERRWAVLDYWYYPEDPASGGEEVPRSFSFRVTDEPVAFA